jgi:hypothetical protein
MQTSAICHIRAIPVLALLLASGVFLDAQVPPEEVRLGGRDGWDHIELRENVMMVDGWQGGQDLALSDWGARIEPTTDMLVPFDFSADDSTGRYRAVPSGVRVVAADRKFGAGAAAFDGQGTVTYRAGPEALLAPDTQAGSFTIDFWLNPFRVSEGASILRWRGALINSGRPVLQELRFEIRDNRAVWRLTNLIVSADEAGRREFSSREITARRGVVPRTWVHHQLRYDATTGQISYRVDGVPEAIDYLTPDGRETFAAAAIYFGADTGDGLVLGDGFHGLIDDFRITRDADRTPQPVSYSGEAGRAYSGPIHLGRSGARIGEIDIRADTPGRTEVRLWYRTADMVVSHDVPDALPSSWREVPPDGVLPYDTRGSFVQLRADLLPDARGNDTPRLQAVTIRHYPEIPPPPPVGLVGESVPSGVALSWDPVFAEDIAGYRVYLGERPNRYLGTTGVRSPVDVGNVTETVVDGLQPDRAYVFAVESYDRYGQTSGLTREVQVRAGRSER